MARRPAEGGGVFPASVEPTRFFKAHKDWVECAGGQAGRLAQDVPVMPVRGLNEERLEENEGLAGDAEAKAHFCKST